MNAAASALYFHPDAYILKRVKLMGRHVAGAGFLRAAVEGLRGETIWGAGSDPAHRPIFETLVRDCDPSAVPGWLALQDRRKLAAIGALTLPGPGLSEEAALRLKHGHAAYSLIGLTHTTATHAVMSAFADLAAGPAMPWDALICTSRAVRDTVEIILAAQADYLRWRLGAAVAPETARLPVIPLGVHGGDFAFDADERAGARKALGLTDEVVFLFVGRLSFHAKAHPEPLYRALEIAAREGRKLALIECGWFANEAIAEAFQSGANLACPSVRVIRVDGRDEAARLQSWAASDVFASLSDNVQETFGLTPIEAMAAGLPCIVSDWNGYRDTIRDGVDGFAIPTIMPGPPLGEPLADAYDEQRLNYDQYIGAAAMMVSVDHDALSRAVQALADDPELRRRFGAAGRARAEAVFDWSVVFKAYRELWAELAEIRRSHPLALAPAPRVPPARLDPFLTFRGYPTTLLGPDSLVRLADGGGATTLDSAHPLFASARWVDPALKDIADAMVQALGPGRSDTIGALADRAGIPASRAVKSAAILLKWGVLRLDPSAGGKADR